MAIENLPNESGESHLSGAYIRSLVKQLTTTTTSPTSKQSCLNTTQNFTYNNNDTLSLVPNYNNTNTMTNTTTKKQIMAKSNHNHNQDLTHGHKKQVRRRLHTSRPYQERLLNMAEARKEIVTALKFHRAAMKQANDRKQQQQQQRQQSNNNQQQVARDYNSYDNCGRKVKSEQLSVDNFLSYQYQPLHNDRNYNQNYYSPSNIISTTPLYDSLNNIPLPNQTLGLNLNLQAFTNLDTNFCHNNNTNTFSTSSNTTTSTTTTTTNPSMVASPSSPSTPVSITTSSTVTEGVGPTISGDSSNNNMHPCLDEDEIAKMRSIGEQYQIEWDDTLNLVKSAWWFKFLKTVDFGKNSFYNNNNKNDDHHHHDVPFEDELMEFPPWLSPTNDESFLHQQLDDSCSEDNTTLPWMDIEDIDGMDDEWLS